MWLAATRCSASATRLRARRFDSARASSSSVRTRRASSCLACSSPRSSSSALGLGLRQARYALELGELGVLRLLELLLELADVLFPVGEALVAARELLELLLDLDLLRQHALLDLQHLRAPVGELRVDLAAQADGLLAGLDLRLAPHRVALAPRVVEQLVADLARLRHSGRAEDRDREQGKGGAYGDPDGNSDPDLHVPAPRSGTQPLFGGTSHPAPDLRGSYPEKPFSGRQNACRESRCATSRATSESWDLSS